MTLNNLLLHGVAIEWGRVSATVGVISGDEAGDGTRDLGRLGWSVSAVPSFRMLLELKSFYGNPGVELVVCCRVYL